MLATRDGNNGEEGKRMTRDILARIEKDQPSDDGKKWQEKLAGDGNDKCAEKKCRDEHLYHRPWRLNDRKGKYTDEDKEEILSIGV